MTSRFYALQRAIICINKIFHPVKSNETITRLMPTSLEKKAMEGVKLA